MQVYSKAEQKNIARRNLENTYVYKGKLFKLARHEEGKKTRDFLMLNVKGSGDSSYNGKYLQKSTASNARESWIPTVKPKTPQPPSFSNKDILTAYEQKAIATKNITNAYDGKKYKLDDDIEKYNKEFMSRLLKAKPSFSSIRNSPKIASVITESPNSRRNVNQQKKPVKPITLQPLSAEQKIKNAYKCKLYRGRDNKNNDVIRKSNEVLMDRLLNAKSSFASIRAILEMAPEDRCLFNSDDDSEVYTVKPLTPDPQPSFEETIKNVYNCRLLHGRDNNRNDEIRKSNEKLIERLINSTPSVSSFRTSHSVKTLIGSFGDGHQKPDVVKKKTSLAPIVNRKMPSLSYQNVLSAFEQNIATAKKDITIACDNKYYHSRDGEVVINESTPKNKEQKNLLLNPTPPIVSMFRLNDRNRN